MVAVSLHVQRPLFMRFVLEGERVRPAHLAGGTGRPLSKDATNRTQAGARPVAGSDSKENVQFSSYPEPTQKCEPKGLSISFSAARNKYLTYP